MACHLGIPCASPRHYQMLCSALVASLVATQLVEAKLRLMEEGHIEDEPSAVMESADYVHMYMHTYAYVCICVCRSGAGLPLS